MSVTVTLGSSAGHHSEAPGDVRAPHLAPSAPGRLRFSPDKLPVPDLSRDTSPDGDPVVPRALGSLLPVASATSLALFPSW